MIGGYGGFGGRVSVLLAQAGWSVLVAGRSLDRASSFCRRSPGLQLTPLAVDRTDELLPMLRAHRPFLVVDAAGPFQASDYRIAQSCILANCHYADLSDGRDFVTGIARLDKAARQAGICVISGVSSVPGLTSAVADRLADGLDRISLVDIALSASNRASGSRSVTEAILSYVGKPVPLWRGGRWTHGFGWQELSRLPFAVPGERPIMRHVALCDVPDLELLPERYPGHPAVRFRAGSELAVQNLGLWLLSWPVRWGWIGSLGALVGSGLLAQKLLRPLGGDRSAMTVIVKGWAAEGALERRWTVYAAKGDGPWIPSLAVPLLAERLGDGQIEPGARPAAGLLDLAGFERMFAPFSIRTASAERAAEPLYLRIMGDDFGRLPPLVRDMHQMIGDAGAEGEAEVATGGTLAQLVARLFRLPSAGKCVALQLWMSEEEGVETWTRTFGTRSFSSRLEQRGKLLVERFGPFRFAMDLVPEPMGLSMEFRRWWIGPVPMPRFLAPRIRGKESEQDGLFRFDVEIGLPLLGRLVCYCGWLRRRTAAVSAGPADRPNPRFPPA